MRRHRYHVRVRRFEQLIAVLGHVAKSWAIVRDEHLTDSVADAIVLNLGVLNFVRVHWPVTTLTLLHHIKSELTFK